MSQRGHLILLSTGLLILLLTLVWLPNAFKKPFADSSTPRYFTLEGIRSGIGPLLKAEPNRTPTAGNIRILSLYQKGCLCNWAARRHESLLEAFAKKKDIAFERIEVQVLDLPATPAVLILDAKDQLSYFGAYGFGAFCSDLTTSYAEAQLNQLLTHKQPPPRLNIIGEGCFCRPAGG